jgi:hypothetical protein
MPLNRPNQSNHSHPQPFQKNAPVEQLIHPKLVGRFVPRKSTATGSTGSGSGSLLKSLISECVPATVSEDFSRSPKVHASSRGTGTGSTACHSSSRHEPSDNYHQAPGSAQVHAYAPPLWEGGTTPDLTEASTTSGSVSGGGAFGSVESMSGTVTTTTNRWLHPHEPPVKEIPMVVPRPTKTTTAATSAASAIDGTNNSSTNSKNNLVGLGTNESTVSTNHDDDHQQKQQLQDRIQVGTRVAVYWDGDDEFFPGTVTKERKSHRKCFFLKYDDGDREWIDFSRHTFRVLDDKKKETVLDDVNENDDDDDDDDDGYSTTQSERNADDVSDNSDQDISCCSKGRRKFKTNAKGKSATVQHNVRVKDNDINRTCSSDGKRKMKTKAEGKSSTAPKVESNSVAVGNGKQNANVSNVDDKYLCCSSEGKRNTKTAAEGKSTTVHRGESDQFVGNVDDNWVAAGFQRSADDSSDDSETDEEEIMQWAEKMFGVTPQRPIARTKTKVEPEFNWDDYADVHIPISEAVKLGRRRNRGQGPTETAAPKIKRCKVSEVDATTEKAGIDAEEEENKRKKQEKRALTADEIRSILGEDSKGCDEATHWVRRSVRQPSKSILNSPQVKALFEKLQSNDTDMVVLKMKKYLNDPNTPSVALDAVLDVLEENTNCEALYIQVSPRKQILLQIRFTPRRVLIFFLPACSLSLSYPPEL